MRYGMILVVMVLAMAVCAGASYAQKGPVENVKVGLPEGACNILQDRKPGRGTDTGRVSMPMRINYREDACTHFTKLPISSIELLRHSSMLQTSARPTFPPSVPIHSRVRARILKCLEKNRRQGQQPV